jgi:hypothetical protein
MKQFIPFPEPDEDMEIDGDKGLKICCKDWMRED